MQAQRLTVTQQFSFYPWNIWKKNIFNITTCTWTIWKTFELYTQYVNKLCTDHWEWKATILFIIISCIQCLLLAAFLADCMVRGQSRVVGSRVQFTTLFQGNYFKVQSVILGIRFACSPPRWQMCAVWLRGETMMLCENRDDIAPLGPNYCLPTRHMWQHVQLIWALRE